METLIRLTLMLHPSLDYKYLYSRGTRSISWPHQVAAAPDVDWWGQRKELRSRVFSLIFLVIDGAHSILYRHQSPTRKIKEKREGEPVHVIHAGEEFFVPACDDIGPGKVKAIRLWPSLTFLLLLREWHRVNASLRFAPIRLSERERTYVSRNMRRERRRRGDQRSNVYRFLAFFLLIFSHTKL